MGNSTPCKIVSPKNFNLKLCIRDYVGEATHYANFGFNSILPAEMRGYRYLTCASYPYPLKTIRILSVQTLLTAVRILSVSVLLTASPKDFRRYF